MNHAALLSNSPTLWLGAVTFRSNRMDIYESLLAKLDGSGRSSVQSITEIFTEWAKREKARGETLGYVYDYVSRKQSLADGLRPFLDNDEYLILAGGEMRGDLTTAVKSLIDNMKAKQEMKDAVMAASLVPALGVGSLLLLSIAFGLFLWPEFVRAIPAQYWPSWTQPCIETQMFLGQKWPLTLALLGLAFLYSGTVDRWTGRSRAMFDHLPPWSIYKGRIAANTLTMLSSLVGSGMSIREAFVMIRDRASPYLRWHMDRIIRKYDASGESGFAALRNGLFSTRMLDRIEDAQAGRSFDETLREVGGRSMNLVVRALRAQAQASSGIVLAIVGVLFMYSTMVMVFGIQEATDAYTAAVTKATGGGI